MWNTISVVAQDTEYGALIAGRRLFARPEPTLSGWQCTTGHGHHSGRPQILETVYLHNTFLENMDK